MNPRAYAILCVFALLVVQGVVAMGWLSAGPPSRGGHAPDRTGLIHHASSNGDFPAQSHAGNF